LHGEVVAVLGGLDDVGGIFALQDGGGAVFDEFRVAFYGEGDEEVGFGGWGGDVEGDVVEVGDDLVDGCGSCAGGMIISAGG